MQSTTSFPSKSNESRAILSSDLQESESVAHMHAIRHKHLLTRQEAHWLNRRLPEWQWHAVSELMGNRE